MKRSFVALLYSVPPICSLLLTASFILLAGAASAATWIVDDDGGPGVDFTDIPPAIAAAATGDLILVRDGAYSGFYLDKSLTIAADTGCQPVITDLCTITAINQGYSAVISGFVTYRLYAHSSAGDIFVDGCYSETSHHWPALTIESCDHVSISRSMFIKKGTGGTIPAAQLDFAEAIISRCAFVGQDGVHGYEWAPAYDGGAGLLAEESTLYFQASSSSGGKGGCYTDLTGIMLGPGDGGPGIELHNSSLHLFGTEECIIEGERGGDSNYGVVGESSSAVKASSSTVAYSGVTFVTYLGKPDIEYDASSVVIEVTPEVPVIILEGSGQLGEYIQPTLYGLPGSTYAMFYSPFQSVIPLGKMYTHLLLDPGHLFFLAGGIIPTAPPPSYVLNIPPHASELQGLPIHFQAYVVTNLGLPYLSTSATFVLR